jgi:hypothetical protein
VDFFSRQRFPWLVEPLVTLLPGSLVELVRPLGIATPFVEVSIAVGLLTRFRNAAVILALGMHLFILFCIGPFGHDWNTGVWPWHGAMRPSSFPVVASRRLLDEACPGSRSFPISRLNTAPIRHHALDQLLRFLGFLPLGVALLRQHQERQDARRRDCKNKLPKTIRDLARKSGAGGTNIVSIADWAFGALNVPPYPEDRVFKNVARHVCA